MNRKDIFFQDKTECNIPFTHIVDNISNSQLKEIDDLYGAADVLSIKNAEKHQRILLALSFVGTIITIFFLLYDEAELHGLIFACLFLIVFLFIIRRMANNLDCHRKYLEYRVLAESLRLQFFLSKAGVKKQVSEILPWFIKKGIPWIEEILSSLPVVDITQKKSVLDCWIRDQKAYHENALKKAEAKIKRDNLITRIAIIITIVSYIVAVLFEFFIYNHISGNIDANLIRAILKIILGTMSATTLFLGSYYGKMSLSNTIEDNKRMISLYSEAEREILENGETDELLLKLAREFLIENSTWYAYQNKNKPDLVF